MPLAGVQAVWARVAPLVPRDFAHVADGQDAEDGAAIGDHHGPFALADHVVIDDHLQRCAGGNAGKVLAHDIAGGELLEDAFELQVRRFGPGCAEEEPADEHHPEPVEQEPGEQQEEPDGDEPIAKSRRRGGDARRPRKLPVRSMR